MDDPLKLERGGARRRRRGGFSFVELVIAVLVFGILATVAAPRWVKSIGQYRVAAAAKQVALDLRLAAARADAKSQPILVEFFPSTHEYRVQGVADPDHPNTEYRVKLKELHGATLASVNFNNQATVTFNGYGVPSSSGSVTLQSGEGQAVVVVDASGQVTIP